MWGDTKPLLQKQFVGRAVLSEVWVGLLAWFSFPVVGINGFIHARSVAGIMWQYLCTSKVLLLSKIPGEVIIKLVA